MIVFVSVSILSAVLFAEMGQNPSEVSETICVRAKGCGNTREAALKDAYRDAVERAVGFYVDAEQMVRNDEILKDQVLTQSNAYIEKCETLKQYSKDNQIWVDILATVRKGALTKRLTEVMPSEVVNVRSLRQDLHAEIFSSLKKSGDAVTLVKNEFENLSPLKQLMKVTLASNKPVIENVPDDDSMVRLWYPVSVSVDEKLYYKTFAPRMDSIFNQIKTAAPARFELKNMPELCKAYEQYLVEKFGQRRAGIKGIMTRSDEKLVNDDRSPLLTNGLALNEEYTGVRFLIGNVWDEKVILSGFYGFTSGSDYAWKVCKKMFEEEEEYEKRHRRVWREFLRDYNGNNYRLDPLPEGGDYAVAVVKKSKGANAILSGTVYPVSYDCAAILSGWIDKTCRGKSEQEHGADEHDSTVPRVNFTMRMKDDDGSEVAGTTFDLMSVYLSNISCVCFKVPDGSGGKIKGGKQMLFISPLVGGFANGYVKWVSIDLPKDDVLKIGTVEFECE